MAPPRASPTRSPPAAELAARPGTYDCLTLAVSRDAVAGGFAEQRGPDTGGPQFTCVFLLRGTLPGDLAFTPDGAALTLAEDHGGCSMTTGTMVGPPPRSRGLRRPRTDGSATAERTAFRPEPGPAPARAPYLVRLDSGAVPVRRDDWVRVGYQGERTTVISWLPAADLALVMP